jgi:hypothetical protein
MDNTPLEIRRDFLDGEDVLLSLSAGDREKVELAIASRAQSPSEPQFDLKDAENTFKISVPIENDEITVIYEIDLDEGILDLVQIKRRGRFKKAWDWLSGLANFEPGT